MEDLFVHQVRLVKKSIMKHEKFDDLGKSMENLHDGCDKKTTNACSKEEYPRRRGRVAPAMASASDVQRDLFGGPDAAYLAPAKPDVKKRQICMQKRRDCCSGQRVELRGSTSGKLQCRSLRD